MNTENKKTKFAYIDAEVHKALKIRSAETDTTVGKYINDILRQYVEDKLVLKRTAEEKHETIRELLDKRKQQNEKN